MDIGAKNSKLITKSLMNRFRYRLSVTKTKPLVTNKKRCGSLKFTLEHQYLI